MNKAHTTLPRVFSPGGSRRAIPLTFLIGGACGASAMGCAPVHTSTQRSDLPSNVVIKVIGTDARPLACVPLAFYGGSLPVMGCTDEMGEWNVPLERPLTGGSAQVRLIPIPADQGLGCDTSPHAVAGLFRRWTFQDRYRFSLEPGCRDALLEIRVSPARTVTLDVAGVGVAPDRVMARSVDWSPMAMSRDIKGRIEIGGLSEKPATFFVIADNRVVPVSIPGGGPAGPLPVFVPASDRGERIALGVSRPDQSRVPEFLAASGLTLVAAEDGGMWTFVGEDIGGELEKVFAINGSPVRVPAGEYWVLPGYFEARPEQYAIWEVARDPVKAEEWRVPRIVVTGTPGEEFIVAGEALRTLLERARLELAGRAPINTP